MGIYQRQPDGSYLPIQNTAIVTSDTPPSNTNLLWYDNINNSLKIFNPNTNNWSVIDMGLKEIDFSKALITTDTDIETNIPSLKYSIDGRVHPTDIRNIGSIDINGFITDNTKIYLLNNETLYKYIQDTRHHINFDLQDTTQYGHNVSLQTVLQIDYGDIVNLTSLNIIGKTNGHNGTSANVYIDISSDGIDWENIYNKSNTNGAVFYVSKPNITLRYLRFRLKASDNYNYQILQVLKIIGVIK